MIMHSVTLPNKLVVYMQYILDIVYIHNITIFRNAKHSRILTKFSFHYISEFDCYIGADTFFNHTIRKGAADHQTK